MRDKVCIMIECENNKNIFTNKKNLNYILEFTKKFNLKVNYAKVSADYIVDLENLAKVFCDQNYESPTEYTIIKKNILCNPDNRKSITKKAKQIREKIKDLILKNKKITFKEIQDTFSEENISISSLSNHFKQVRTELALHGFNLAKIKNGIYRIIMS